VILVEPATIGSQCGQSPFCNFNFQDRGTPDGDWRPTSVSVCEWALNKLFVADSLQSLAGEFQIGHVGSNWQQPNGRRQTIA
jgi:hypothetical protein